MEFGRSTTGMLDELNDEVKGMEEDAIGKRKGV